MATAKKTANDTMDFIEVQQGSFSVILLGQSPLIMNSMSAKAKQELLLPRGRKTAAEKAATVKHVPKDEFRDSIYYTRDPDAPTACMMPAVAFKRSIMGAALDIPGAKKAQLGRLMYVLGDEVCIYGIPELMMSVVRSADMNRTPDVRSRAIFPAWCAKITIRHTEPMLRGPAVLKLAAAAGIMQGVGDWRPEKGSGNYGQFALVDSEDHPQVKILMQTAGREAQTEAIKNPVAFDAETESLLEHYDAEVRRRGIRVAA